MVQWLNCRNERWQIWFLCSRVALWPLVSHLVAQCQENGRSFPLEGAVEFNTLNVNQSLLGTWIEVAKYYFLCAFCTLVEQIHKSSFCRSLFASFLILKFPIYFLCTFHFKRLFSPLCMKAFIPSSAMHLNSAVLVVFDVLLYSVRC